MLGGVGRVPPPPEQKYLLRRWNNIIYIIQQMNVYDNILFYMRSEI